MRARNQNALSLGLISIGTRADHRRRRAVDARRHGLHLKRRRRKQQLRTVVGFGSISTPTVGPSRRPGIEVPPGDQSPIDRLVIPNAKIDAPVVTKGVDEAGVMQAPDNAYDTAWYDFSAKPGFDGNAVFAGHVDYVHVGPAVFWNIKDLKEGDLVEVRLHDGTVYTLRRHRENAVRLVRRRLSNTIVGPTPNQTVTLITCSGTFNSATHQYDKRLVVRAERLPDGAAPGLPPAAAAPGA